MSNGNEQSLLSLALAACGKKGIVVVVVVKAQLCVVSACLGGSSYGTEIACLEGRGRHMYDTDADTFLRDS
jgi:hypothetical protein